MRCKGFLPFAYHLYIYTSKATFVHWISKSSVASSVSFFEKGSVDYRATFWWYLRDTRMFRCTNHNSIVVLFNVNVLKSETIQWNMFRKISILREQQYVLWTRWKGICKMQCNSSRPLSKKNFGQFYKNQQQSFPTFFQTCCVCFYRKVGAAGDDQAQIDHSATHRTPTISETITPQAQGTPIIPIISPPEA